MGKKIEVGWMNSDRFNGKTLSMYTDNLMAGIFKNINIVKHTLEKDNFPIGFTERDISIIINELLYYFLNICDRQLHNIYDHEIKTKIMNSLIDLIAKTLDEVKDDIMEERLAELNQNNFGLYLKILGTTYDSQVFISTYNKRQKEYENYLALFENTKKDLDKTLEKKYVDLVKPQICIKERPITEFDMVLWSIPMETHFYAQLCKVISKIEQQIKPSNGKDGNSD